MEGSVFEFEIFTEILQIFAAVSSWEENNEEPVERSGEMNVTEGFFPVTLQAFCEVSQRKKFWH